MNNLYFIMDSYDMIAIRKNNDYSSFLSLKIKTLSNDLSTYLLIFNPICFSISEYLNYATNKFIYLSRLYI